MKYVAAILIAIMAGAVWLISQPERPPYQPVYAFELPATMLTCMVYELHDNEQFSHWHIKQPMMLKIRANSITRIENTFFEGGCVFRPMLQMAADSDVNKPLCGSDDPNVPYKADKPWQLPGGTCDMEIYEREMRK